MKKLPALLIIVLLNGTICFCQLLSNPSLTVEDFEIGLTNTDHLRKILKKHDFKYSITGASKFNSAGRMSNPLYPDVRTLKSEDWVLRNSQNQVVFIINLFEWEHNHAPRPGISKSIRIMVNRNSEYANHMMDFLERIKNKYSNKSTRYFRDNDLYKQFGDPMNVYTNGSCIEVRTGPTDPMYIHFYTINFDLI